MSRESSEHPSELASMLGARRDRTAGAESSRGLLMTVLGEFVLPSGGSAWTQTVIAGLGLVGVQEKAVRQALARMETDGWLQRERVGRRTRWHLTDELRGVLTDGARRIYGFGHHPRQWDEQWVVLLASVPESDRASRYRMAQRLSWLGFGHLGQGTWICPWVEQERAVQSVLDDRSIEATSFRGPVGLFGSGPQLARQAWPIDELARSYRQFLADFPEKPAASTEEAVKHLIRVVHEWRRYPFLDPGLPAELLPEDWPVGLAAQRFAAIREAHVDTALAWWQHLDDATPEGAGSTKA